MARDDGVKDEGHPASGSDETAETTVAANPIKLFYETQRSIEKFRIQMGNRKSALERGVDEVDAVYMEVYSRLFDGAVEMESAVDKALAHALEEQPVWNHWLKHVKGIGPSLAAAMLALLLPPLPERGPSTWFKAAGLVPEERCAKCGGLIERHPGGEQIRCPDCGSEDDLEVVNDGGGFTRFHCAKCGAHFVQAAWEQRPEQTWCVRCVASMPTIMRLPKARAGEGATTYHRWLRRCLWNVATSFVRTGGYYRTVYEQEKARLTQVHSGDAQWPPYRLDDVARWAMVKVFLIALWEKWSEAEGMPSRKAYVVEKLGHVYKAPPEWSGKGKI